MTTKKTNIVTTKSEHAEQVELFAWIAKVANFGFDYADGLTNFTSPQPALHYAFAIPNGGARADNRNVAAIRGNMLRNEGVRRGVPDIMIPVPSCGKHGLFIEMKITERKRAHVSKAQLEYLEYLQKVGYSAHVCYGANEAKQVIRKYFNPNRG